MPMQCHLAAVDRKRRRSFDDGIGAMSRQRTGHHIADAGNTDTMNDMQRRRADDDSAVCGFIAQPNDGKCHDFEILLISIIDQQPSAITLPVLRQALSFFEMLAIDIARNNPVARSQTERADQCAWGYVSDDMGIAAG